MDQGDGAARYQTVLSRAEARYLRRKAATDWFWHWAKKRWNGQPHTTTKVARRIAAKVPALASSPRRHTHVCYEDCLALEDEAFLLLDRLYREQKRGGRFDISKLEPTETPR